MINKKISANKLKKVNDYDLEITLSGTVYSRSKKGLVKLKAFYDVKIKSMVIELPNKEIVKLIPVNGGLMTQEEYKFFKAGMNARKDK